MDDFVQSQSNVNVKLINDRIIAGVSVFQCAKSCVEMEGGSCATFAYCSEVSECRLSTSALSNVGQTGPDAVATCNIYSSKSITTRDRSRNFPGIFGERNIIKCFTNYGCIDIYYLINLGLNTRRWFYFQIFAKLHKILLYTTKETFNDALPSLYTGSESICL